MTEPDIVKVSAAQGIGWIGRSFSLFGANPGIWIVMFLIFVGINFGLTMVPFLELLPTVLAPAFTVGFYIGCMEIKAGRGLQIDHLFYGFRRQGRMLIRLGFLYFICNIVIYLLTTLFLKQIISPEQLQLLADAQANARLEQAMIDNPELIQAILNALMLAIILTIPLLMASWFSPALVAFHQVAPLRAMSLSIKACNRNLLPLLVYGLLILPLMVLAIIPLGLGMLVMLPVIIISQFVSYQEVFARQLTDDDSTDEEDGTITL